MSAELVELPPGTLDPARNLGVALVRFYGAEAVPATPCPPAPVELPGQLALPVTPATPTPPGWPALGDQPPVPRRRPHRRRPSGHLGMLVALVVPLGGCAPAEGAPLALLTVPALAALWALARHRRARRHRQIAALFAQLDRHDQEGSAPG